MVSVTVRVTICGGGGGAGAGAGELSWDGGTGWVGSWSGRAPGCPAPDMAKLDTDWMTGIDASVPALETWVELFDEVPVEAGTTIACAVDLDLLTLKTKI